jgi:tetratricopeptide (TPR) repeat protein
MPTKLSRYADGIMEAAWLAALIVVPVFFNIYSSRIFEPDKITLLRTLALLILAAWIIKLIEEGGARWEQIKPDESRFRFLLRVPLIAPVAALVIVYIISTIFSVTPRVSLLGSYQRLQGTYTTFSYLVVFASMIANLRRKAQVERLIGVVVITSLPVSLYGILQRFKLDPIPWGGDVTYRIASDMGNSIFVGAYFVMAFPLIIMRIVESFEALLKERGNLGPNLVRSTAYVFIAALQVIALYMTGSRGPWLGWGASLIFIGLGLSLIWRARWLTITGVSQAVAAAGLLIVLNIPNGPLAGLRTVSGLDRLGHLLDAESQTGQVRTLIWQGAAKLVAPHPPLEFPDGTKDAFNFLRPLIGYGPESMYVAYNPFYPPALTQVEKRNASPDRSHNETWDSLVITGVLGLVVYLTLFGLVLYYGLKWLGLVKGGKQRNLYLALYLAGGVVSSIVFVLWKGVGYLGVALPFGIILGVIIYLISMALSGGIETPHTPQEKLRAYVLLSLLAAVVAHYLEINFGIAIASTRTYFWTYSALLLLVGYILPLHGEYPVTSLESSPSSSENGAREERSSAQLPTRNSGSRQDRNKKAPTPAVGKKRRTSRAATASSVTMLAPWLRQALIIGLIVAILLTTLGYNYISNSSRASTATGIFWNSIFHLDAAGTRSSYGLLALFLTTWLIGVLLLASESVRNLVVGDESQVQTWGKMIAVALGVSMLAALIYWLWHAADLAALARATATTIDDVVNQVKSSEGILTTYYIYLFVLLFGLGVCLPPSWPVRQTRSGTVSIGAAVGALIVVFILASYTNLRVIQADIAFKTGDLFAQPKSWPVAITIYNRANELAPSEDYYYLFLGRAYLEYARSLTDATQRDQLIMQAASDLRKAQEINPLNTDHTANLARLYSLWASATTDAALRAERAAQSEQYFSRALILSPNNAKLWDESALLYLNILQQPDEGYRRLQHALEIDPYYDWSYGLMGDYYVRFVINVADLQTDAKQQALEKAAENYELALKYSGSDTGSLLVNYYLALGGIYTQLSQFDKAISDYQRAMPLAAATDKWRIEEGLARLYAQTGDLQNALIHARNALASAPDDQKERIRVLITQLGG